MQERCVEISLFGACRVIGIGADAFELSGAKHRALFALLATAPFGRRSRAFLQETLWGVACYDAGRQSLRRALADIKAIMGPAFGKVLSSTNMDVTLDLSAVRFVGRPGAGAFLEGLDIREPAFRRWAAGIRDDPAQLEGLYRHTAARALPTALPAIAVLPLRPLDCGERGEALGDWFAAELARALSRSRLMAVISHLSSRRFARAGVDLADVQATLKAHYCVAGHLRRAGDEIFGDVDFIDMASSRILFTRRFALPAERFTAGAVERIGALAQAMAAAIAEQSLIVAAGRAPGDIAEHQLLISGVSLMHRATLREFARSRQFLEEALARSPGAPEVLAWLAKWYVLSVFNRWTDDAGRDSQTALDYVARALDNAPDNPFCLTIDGFAHNNLRRRLDIAERRYAAALEINSSEALCWLLKSALHTFRDEAADAVECALQARALSPVDPFGYYYDAHTAGAYLCAGDYETAFRLADAAYASNSRHLSSLRIKIFAACHSGRDALLPELGRRLLQSQPDFTIAAYMRTHPSAGSAMGERMRRALAAAHIPQGS